MSDLPWPWVAPSLRGGFNAHNTRIAMGRSETDARASGRKSEMSVAEKLLWQACINPPTTAEWLAQLRRSGDPERWGRWVGDRWVTHRRPRPFIRPAGSYCVGLTWRRLP